MKKLLLIIGILIAANVLLAQEEGSPQLEEDFRARIMERLELEADQESQLKELRQKYSQEMRSIRADDERPRSEQLYAAAEVAERREQELARILSKKQLNEMKIIKKEIKQRRIKRRKRMLRRRFGR